MSALSSTLIGQPAALRVLQRAQQTKCIASAYLFVGPPGVGKRTAALHWAADLLQLDESGRRRAFNGNHPDVRLLVPSEGSGNLAVEFIRQEVLPWSRFAPFEAPAAVAILPNADRSLPRQHAEAANALLKALEEPRPRLHWLLTAERPERLLATVRSRCQRLRFVALAPADIDLLLDRHSVPPAERPLIAALARGSIGRALRLAQQGLTAQRLSEVQRFDRAWAAADDTWFALAEEWVKAVDLAERLQACQLWYRDVAWLAAGLDAAGLLLPMCEAALRRRAATFGLAAAASMVQRLASVLDGLQTNANPQLALEAMQG